MLSLWRHLPVIVRGLPSMVLHVGGNFLGGIGLLARGHREWQASSSPQPLIWEGGTDASFWISCVVVFIVGSATVGAYAALAMVARRASEGPALT
jgi:hypothetical protein